MYTYVFCVCSHTHQCTHTKSRIQQQFPQSGTIIVPYQHRIRFVYIQCHVTRAVGCKLQTNHLHTIPYIIHDRLHNKLVYKTTGVETDQLICTHCVFTYCTDKTSRIVTSFSYFCYPEFVWLYCNNNQGFDYSASLKQQFQTFETRFYKYFFRKRKFQYFIKFDL